MVIGVVVAIAYDAGSAGSHSHSEYDFARLAPEDTRSLDQPTVAQSGLFKFCALSSQVFYLRSSCTISGILFLLGS